MLGERGATPKTPKTCVAAGKDCSHWACCAARCRGVGLSEGLCPPVRLLFKGFKLALTQPRPTSIRFVIPWPHTTERTHSECSDAVRTRELAPGQEGVDTSQHGSGSVNILKS